MNVDSPGVDHQRVRKPSPSEGRQERRTAGVEVLSTSSSVLSGAAPAAEVAPVSSHTPSKSVARRTVVQVSARAAERGYELCVDQRNGFRNGVELFLYRLVHRPGETESRRPQPARFFHTLADVAAFLR